MRDIKKVVDEKNFHIIKGYLEGKNDKQVLQWLEENMSIFTEELKEDLEMRIVVGDLKERGGGANFFESLKFDFYNVWLFYGGEPIEVTTKNIL